MRLFFLLFALFTAVLTFLSFTVDKRLANDEGYLNPLFFLKQTFAVWKKNINKSNDELWTNYLENVRTVYGEENATLIEPVVKVTLNIYKKLPPTLKATVDGILTGFRNGTYKFRPDVINQLIPKLIISVQSREIIQYTVIKNKIETELFPLAKKVFFNPFDQASNNYLDDEDIDEIGFFTGR